MRIGRHCCLQCEKGMRADRECSYVELELGPAVANLNVGGAYTAWAKAIPEGFLYAVYIDARFIAVLE